MMKPDLTDVMHALAESENLVKRSRAICDSAAHSLHQTQKMLNDVNATCAVTQLTLNELRRQL